MRRILSLVVAFALGASPALVLAQPVSHAPQGAAPLRAVPPRWGWPRVDPRADMLFAHRARYGETVPVFYPSRRFEREGSLPVVVRFTEVPAAGLLRARMVFSSACAMRLRR